MKITLLHPSYGRPDKAATTLNYWMMQSSGIHEIEHVLIIDKHDPEYENYSSDKFPANTIFCRNGIENSNVVQATNLAAAIAATGDILIYMSDDFSCPFHWDKILVKRILAQPKKEWLLKVNDGLQPFDVAVLTIPIMSYQLYEKLGYFWYPEYKSMFVDEDLYWTAMRMDVMIMAPELLFQHEHHTLGKADHDDTYRRSEKNWDQGKALFLQRKAAGFPSIYIGPDL